MRPNAARPSQGELALGWERSHGAVGSTYTRVCVCVYLGVREVLQGVQNGVEAWPCCPYLALALLTLLCDGVRDFLSFLFN